MFMEIREVTTRRDLRKFIHLPARIHKGHTTWMPPVYPDEWNYFNPAKNHTFEYCDTVLYLAMDGKQPVGRIMGIINRRYNEIRGIKTGRWGCMETFDDQAVAALLLGRVEDWCRSRGMDRIVGPYGFSDKDPQGFIISGFEHPPLLASACNFPYQVKLVEHLGYTREIDCFVYKYKVGNELPAIYSRIIQRTGLDTGYRVVEFKSRGEVRPHVVPILELMNRTYSALYGFVPLNEQEMNDFASRYLPVLDPRFIKVVYKSDEVVAFIIGLPNMTQGIIRSKGYLFPLGWYHILRSAKRTRQLDLMLGAVHPAYQGLGIDVLMAVSLWKSVVAAGFDTVEIHLMLETNTRVLAEMERIGATVHKQFRVFGKSL